MQNEFINELFTLGKINNESDLHEYKNLLNSISALFYTNHRLNDVTVMFKIQREVLIEIQKDRVLQEQYDFENKKKQQHQPSKKVVQKLKCNLQLEFKLIQNWKIKNCIKIIKTKISKICLMKILLQRYRKTTNQKYNHSYQRRWYINSLKNEGEDMIIDGQARKFLEKLQQVGPYSKQILNYSYPQLLFQRGNDEEIDSQEDNNNGELSDLIDDEGEDKEDQLYIEQIHEVGNVYLVEANQYNDYVDKDEMDCQIVSVVKRLN
ncbi:UNKNOWN [Stylonychia lemnae]|uniref:Uncharacterized protein n=1 Tax=Stylonychia lemnae TaxID=5949 RepID=A0A078AL57_STYLE|nr:UNKNOWN [Stylonychia lemnae]|eukprot:CDW82152.1 UNKNOWN [Stylonychia lemnae]